MTDDDTLFGISVSDTLVDMVRPAPVIILNRATFDAWVEAGWITRDGVLA